MLRRAVLVCVVLVLVADLGVVAEQNEEEMDKYGLQAGIGASLLVGGIALGLCGIAIAARAYELELSEGEGAGEPTVIVALLALLASGGASLAGTVYLASGVVGMIIVDAKKRNTVARVRHAPTSWVT